MTFRRLQREILAELKAAKTTQISDAFDELGINGVMEGIFPVIPGSKVVGQAVTTRKRFVVPAPPQIRTGEVIKACQPGDVIVIDNGGAKVGTWGGLVTLLAKNQGVAGAIINGYTRDVAEIRAENFPVWCKGTTPTSSVKRLATLAINEPVICGNVLVRPGDVIVADDDGVVCIPLDRFEEVLEIVRAKIRWEEKTFSELRRGIIDAVKDRVL